MTHRLQKLALVIGVTLSMTSCMSIMETPDDLVLLELHAPPANQNPGWMHVVLGSTFDYQKYVIENKLDAGVKGKFCGKPKQFDSRTVSTRVYSNYDGHEIYDYAKYSDVKKDGYYRYDIFINAIRP
jgi:hypothetical protein